MRFLSKRQVQQMVLYSPAHIARLENAGKFRSVIVGNPDGTVGIGGGSNPTPEAASSTPSGNTTPPVVTLTGSATVQLTVGDSWTDPGATAEDDTDGDLTGEIQETGSVDTAIAGLYTLTYSVTDAAGNTGSVSRLVSVLAATSTSPATDSTASAPPSSAAN